MKRIQIIAYALPMTVLFLIPGCFTERKEEKQEAAAVKPQELKEEVPMEKIEPKVVSTILKESKEGKSPTRGKKVTVHYTGWLANEKGEPRLDAKFDSSVDRNQPFSFNIGVGQVIKGWDEGVMEMKVGEKRRLVIPSELAYGTRGAGRVIPPNANLVFDVELLGVE
jgi:FKBP-type peptidyl-prolyl cis-trans isomerase